VGGAARRRGGGSRQRSGGERQRGARTQQRRATPQAAPARTVTWLRSASEANFSYSSSLRAACGYAGVVRGAAGDAIQVGGPDSPTQLPLPARRSHGCRQPAVREQLYELEGASTVREGLPGRPRLTRTARSCLATPSRRTVERRIAMVIDWIEKGDWARIGRGLNTVCFREASRRCVAEMCFCKSPGPWLTVPFFSD
jgi:hypothetical protein